MNVSESALKVPVLDVGALMRCENDTEVAEALREDNADMKAVLDSIRAASTEWGFFYVSNHGVSHEQMQSFQSAMRSFFALSEDIKNSLRVTPNNPRGYNEKELTKQKLDWKQVFDMGGPRDNDAPVGGKRNQWPSEDDLPGFRETMIQQYITMVHLARRLLQVVAVALGERVDYFDQFFPQGDGTPGGDHTSFLRLNYYPIAPEPEKTMGVYHHTDVDALTVLLQDDEVASLQVFHQGQQQWVLVPPIKDTFVINLGDLVQVWSNDKFVTPLHRVLARGDKQRFSAAFFYFPSLSSTIQPILMKEEDDKPHYVPFNFLEFLRRRFEGNLEDVGEETQVAVVASVSVEFSTNDLLKLGCFWCLRCFSVAERNFLNCKRNFIL